MSTLARTIWPSVASMTSSRMGPRSLHGPHQGAHRSTTTGRSSERARTSVSKVASVTSIVTTQKDTAVAWPFRTTRERGEPVGQPGQEVESGDVERGTQGVVDHVPSIAPPPPLRPIARGPPNPKFHVNRTAGA